MAFIKKDTMYKPRVVERGWVETTQFLYWPVSTFSDVDNREIVRLVKQAQYNRGKDEWLEAIYVVKNLFGAHKHLSFMEARVHHERKLKRDARALKKRQHQERQNDWWRKGGRGRHYLKKFGVYGTLTQATQWLQNKLFACTGCWSGEGKDLPHEDEEADVYEPVLKVQRNKCWGCGIRSCTDDFCGGCVRPVPLKPLFVKRLRDQDLLQRLRAFVEQLKNKRGASSTLSYFVEKPHRIVAQHQIGEGNEHGEGTVSQVKESNVVLTEQHGTSITAEPTVASRLQNMTSDKIVRFKNQVMRPLVYDVYTWQTTTDVTKPLFELDLPFDFIRKNLGSINMIPFLNNRYFRGDIRVRIQLNSNKFMQGQLIVGWFYQPKADKSFSMRMNRQSLVQTNHVLLNAGTSNCAELFIPYRYYKGCMEVGCRRNRDDGLQMGKLICYVMNPLTASSATANACNVTLIMSIENAGFTGTIHKTFNDLPQAEHQMETAIATGVALGVSALLDKNRDKPTIPSNPDYYSPQSAQSWCLGTKISETTNPLRLHNAMVPHPSFYADDEFTIASIVRRYGFLKTIDWTNSQVHGTLIWHQPANPLLPQSYYTTEDVAVKDKQQTLVYLPPCSVMSALYQYWKGTLKFRIDVVATEMHSGSLIIGYIPGPFNSNATIEEIKSSAYAIIDIKEKQQTEFIVPYVNDKEFAVRYLDITQESENSSSPGYIYMFVLNQLVYMDSISDTVKLNLYLAAGPDFELTVPTQSSIGLGYNPDYKIPAADKSQALPGYYPYYTGTYTDFDLNNKADFGSKDHLVAIMRYGVGYGHITQMYMPAKPKWEKDTAGKGLITNTCYYLQVPTTKEWKIRANDSATERTVPVQACYPWTSNGYTYLVPIRKDTAVEFCKLMNTYCGDYTKFIKNEATNNVWRWFYSYKNDDADPYIASDNFAYTVVSVTGIQAPNTYNLRRTNSIDFDIIEHAEHQMENPVDNRFDTSSEIINVGGSVPSSGNGVAFFGEDFGDLKDLCRRYQMYGAYSLELTSVRKLSGMIGDVIFNFPVKPQGLNLNVETEFSNYNREGHIPICLSAYRYFRGSIRFRIHLPVPNMTIAIQHHPYVNMYSDSIQASPKESLHITDRFCHSSPIVIQSSTVNDIVSFEVPYYLPFDQMLLQDVYWGKGHQTFDNELNAAMCMGYISVTLVNIPVYTASKYDKAIFNVMYSLGDDARPSVFQGFPPMIYTQALPYVKLSAEHQINVFGISKKDRDNISVTLDKIAKLDLNRTNEEIYTTFQDMAPLIPQISETLNEIQNYATNSAEGMTMFLKSLENSALPTVIVSALTNIAHVVNNPTPSTMAISTIGFLTVLGVVSLDVVSMGTKLLEKLFTSLQPKQQNGDSAQAVHQIDFEDKDFAALGSMLFSGISTTLNYKGLHDSKFASSVGADLCKGMTEGLKGGNFFFTFLNNCVSSILKIIKYLWNKMCPVSLGLEHLIQDRTIVAKWADEATFLTDQRLENVFDAVPNLGVRVELCFTLGSCIYSKMISAPKGVNIAVLKDLYHKVASLRTTLADKGVCAYIRREPFVVCISGQPGIGKSHMATKNIMRLLKSAGIRSKSSPIYTHPAGAKYWENVNQEPAMYIDDTVIFRSGETSDSEIATLMGLKSCALFTPPIAECDRKKKRYAPELVYMHMNTAFPNMNNMQCASAFLRRRDVLWQVDLKDGLTRQNYKERSTSEALRNYQYLEFKLAKNPANSGAGWGPPLSYDEFMAYNEQAFNAFRTKQLAEYTENVSAFNAAMEDIEGDEYYKLSPLSQIVEDLCKINPLAKTMYNPNQVAEHEIDLIDDFQDILAHKSLYNIGEKQLLALHRNSKVSEDVKEMINEWLYDYEIVPGMFDIYQRLELNITPNSPNAQFFKDMIRICGCEPLYALVKPVFNNFHDRTRNDLLTKITEWETAFLEENKKLHASLARVAYPNVIVQNPEEEIQPDVDYKIQNHKLEEKFCKDINAMSTCINKLNSSDVRELIAGTIDLTPEEKKVYKDIQKDVKARLDAISNFDNSITLGIERSGHIERCNKIQPTVCDYHIKRFIKHIEAQNIEDAYKIFGKVDATKISAKDIVSWKITATTGTCRHFYIYDRSFSKTTANCKCFKEDIPHYCSKVCDENCNSDCLMRTNIPILDDFSDCKHCCFRIYKMRVLAKKLYINSHPGILHQMKHDTDTIPTIVKSGDFRMRLESVKSAISETFSRVKDWLRDKFSRVLGKLTPVYTFFKNHWKLISAAISVIVGAGFAIWKREKITNLFPETTQKVQGFVSQTTSSMCEKFRKFYKSKGDVDSVDLVIDAVGSPSNNTATHEIISSGDARAAARSARVAFKAKAISTAGTIHSVAHHETENSDIACERIHKNTFFIIGSEPSAQGVKDTLQIRCLALGLRYAITVRHGLEVLQNHGYQKVTVFNGDVPITFPLGSLRSNILLDSSLVLIEFPAQFPQRKKIIQFFATEADHSLRLPTTGALIEIDDKKIHIYDAKLEVMTEHIEITGIKAATDIKINNLYKYKAQHPGMCGSILTGDRLNRCIIGMHIAGDKNAGIGYAEPLFYETFAPLFGELVKDVSEPVFFPPEDSPITLQETIFPIGSVGRKMAHHNPTVTAIHNSAIYGFVPPKTAPAPLVATDPRLPPGNSPLIKGCEKHGICTQNFPPEVLKITKERLFNHLITKCKPLRNGKLVLTDAQAVVGDLQLPFCDPLKWSTSEGYPFTKLRPRNANDKKWLFKLKETNEGYEFQGFHYKLSSILNFKRKQRSEGVVQPTIFVDCLKDARISIEKCHKPGKTRIFSMSPVDYTIEFRKYFYDFISSFQVKRLENFNAIGIAVSSDEWDVLARRLNRFKNICTGDYTNFGPGLNEEVAKLCLDIILEWYDHFEPLASEEERRTRACLVAELINAKHLCNDLVYDVAAGIPSGSPITAVLNSLVNIFYIMASWEMMSVTWPLEKQTFQNFYKDLELFTYGDDFILSVSDRYKELFNAATIGAKLGEFDIIMTDASKGETITPYTSLQNSTFLKGHFVYFMNRWWYGLEKSQIYDMCNYVTSRANLIESTVQNCDMACIAAHGHGHAFYDVFTKQLIKAFSKLDYVYVPRTFGNLTELKSKFLEDPTLAAFARKWLLIF